MIVPMKRATLFCLKEDRASALLALQRCGEFMPAEAVEDGQETALAEDAVLHDLKPYRKKKGFFTSRAQIGESEFEREDEGARALLRRAKDLTDERQALAGRYQAALERERQLLPWENLPARAERLRDTAYTRVFTGFVPAQQTEAVGLAAASAGCEIQLLDKGENGVAAFALCAKEDAEEAQEALRGAGFAFSPLPFVQGSAKEALRDARAALSEIERRQEEIERSLQDIAAEGGRLEALSDRARAREAREQTVTLSTEMTEVFEGWVREDRVQKLQKALDRALPELYTLSLRDPQEGETVPTAVKNNRFVRPFETITDMFSIPPQGSLDPNPVMSVWYWVIFGMMVGDVGYGTLMLIGLTLFKKLKKPRGEMAKLVDVLLFSSVPTMLFGVLYGSYFGASWFAPVFVSPLEDPVSLLIASLAVGLLHIFSGMIMKMADDFRHHRPWDAIFDQLSWIVILLGCVLLVLPATRTAGTVMAVAGVATVLLTAGRKKKGFGKVTGGLLGLYNITGFVSDILSYSRILALALSSGVVGMVMNLLASMVRGEGFNPLGLVLSAVIYLIGHVFNIAMSLLSAYVHDSRLQYIEFFGKFYEGGGVPFRPLTRETRYVDVTEDSVAINQKAQ